MFEFDFADLPEAEASEEVPPSAVDKEANNQPSPEASGCEEGLLFDFDHLPQKPDAPKREPGQKDKQPPAPRRKEPGHGHRRPPMRVPVRKEQADEEDGEVAEDAEEEIGTDFNVALTADQGHDTLAARDGVRRLLEERLRKKSPASAAVFAHHDPGRTVRFGGWFGSLRAPVVFLEALSPSVAAYIREDPDGPFADLDTSVRETYWANWGFDEDKQETMLKQDWHSMPQVFTEGKFFVPRLAEGGLLLRAPPRVMAFVVAFRVVNKAVWSTITEALVGLHQSKELWVRHKFGESGIQRYRRSTHYKMLHSVISAMRSQRFFGVVEAQVRWGSEDHRMPSHKDGATSLLHLSTTLGGRRRVWAGTFERSGSKAARVLGPDGKRLDPEVNVYDDEVWQPPRLQQFEMTKGCTYVSSPFCFEHAVEYYACDRSEPVIALQCRFGFTPEAGKLLNNMRTQEMLEISTLIAESLRVAGAAGQLRMPTLNEVVQADEQLRTQLEETLGGQ